MSCFIEIFREMRQIRKQKAFMKKQKHLLKEMQEITKYLKSDEFKKSMDEKIELIKSMRGSNEPGKK